MQNLKGWEIDLDLNFRKNENDGKLFLVVILFGLTKIKKTDHVPLK